MASRASWRTAPGDPRSRVGWLLLEAPRWGVLVLKKAILGVVAISLYAAYVGASAALLPALLALFALVRALPDPPEPPAVADPPPAVTFCGTIRLFRKGAFLGEDRVVATFLDGWLHVEGVRTTFALRSSDASLAPDSVLRLEDGTEVRFDVRVHRRSSEQPRTHVAVSFVRFEDEFRRWLKYPPADGESLLPPDVPHPSAHARAEVDLAVASIGTVAVGVAFVVFGLVPGVATLLLFPGPPLVEAIRVYRRLHRRARPA